MCFACDKPLQDRLIDIGRRKYDGRRMDTNFVDIARDPVEAHDHFAQARRRNILMAPAPRQAPGALEEEKR